LAGSLAEKLRFEGSLNTTKCVESPDIHKSKVWQRWWKGFYDKNTGTWSEDNVMMKFAKSGGAGNCPMASQRRPPHDPTTVSPLFDQPATGAKLTGLESKGF
jgi:hypothetical protein